MARAILSLGLKDSYVEAGIKGTLSGDEPGILDFMNATENTTFQNTGLRAQGYQPRSVSLDKLCDNIIAIAMEDLQ